MRASASTRVAWSLRAIRLPTDRIVGTSPLPRALAATSVPGTTTVIRSSATPKSATSSRAVVGLVVTTSRAKPRARRSLRQRRGRRGIEPGLQRQRMMDQRHETQARGLGRAISGSAPKASPSTSTIAPSGSPAKRRAVSPRAAASGCGKPSGSGRCVDLPAECTAVRRSSGGHSHSRRCGSPDRPGSAKYSVPLKDRPRTRRAPRGIRAAGSRDALHPGPAVAELRRRAIVRPSRRR